MISFLGSAYPTGASVLLVSFELEALLMYGLVALVIGLIAWSKYNEPPLSDPYAGGSSNPALRDTSRHGNLAPVVEPPIVAEEAAAREER